MRGQNILFALCLLVATSHPAASLQAGASPVFEFSVEAASAEESARLGQSYDVVTRRGDLLVVLGSAATQQQLAADGFVVRAARPLPQPEPAFGAQTYYGGYRTVAETEAFMDGIATARPDLATMITYGQSWRKANNRPNGHDLKAICLTRRRPQDCQLNPNTDKPRLLLMAAIHPRELSTSEMAMHWIEFLVNGYGVHPDVTWLMDYHELWVIPVSNPDGRWIVEQGSPTPHTQRKNANDSQGNCSVPPSDWSQHGVDLNRNASFQWLAQNSPCSLTYPGTAAASEPEQQALEALMAQLFHDQRGPSLSDAAPITTTGAMLTLHSYSDMILLPWGWVSCTPNQLCPPSQRAPNDAGLRAFAFRMGYFTGYAVGQASELLYSARGTTDDWAYGVLGIPAFTFEIGPDWWQSCGGFMPPYTCQESFWQLNREAFVYAAKVARQPYALAHGPMVITATVSPSAVRAGQIVTVAAQANDNALGQHPNSYGRPPAQIVTAAEVYLATPPWDGGAPLLMSAQDGTFDAPLESLVGALDTTGLPSGRHLVFVRAQDANGNWGPVTAAWLTIVEPRLIVPLVQR